VKAKKKKVQTLMNAVNKLFVEIAFKLSENYNLKREELMINLILARTPTTSLSFSSETCM
jgi:hypothetical protein